MSQSVPENILDEISDSKKVFWRMMRMNMIQNHIPSLIDQILVIQHLLFIPALHLPPRELDKDQNLFIHLSFLIFPHQGQVLFEIRMNLVP